MGGVRQMVSEKIKKMAQNNSAIRAMFEEGRKMAEQYGRENVYDFSLGNPNFPAPEAVKRAMIDLLNEEDPVYLHGYMSNAGFESVRAAVADSINARFGTAYNENNIIMVSGASPGLNIVLKTLLDPDDEVIVFAPYFVDYGNYVANFGGRLVVVEPTTADFQPDPAALEAAITPRTRVVILNSPNNPTGVIYSAETLTKLAAVLEKKQKEYGTSIYILSDEPYRELAYDGAEVPYVTKYYRNAIVCYSWSKSLSLPGERIGYVVIPSEVDDYDLVFAGAVISFRVLGYVNAPSLQQLAVARCLHERTDVSAYDANRKLLYEGLTKCGFECVFPQGAFYMWMKTPIEDDKAFSAAAKKYRLLLVPGSSFAGPGYVRIAYCVSPETIRNSMPSFRQLAEEFGLKGAE